MLTMLWGMTDTANENAGNMIAPACHNCGDRISLHLIHLMFFNRRSLSIPFECAVEIDGEVVTLHNVIWFMVGKSGICPATFVRTGHSQSRWYLG
jgi:hypothetical protein